LAQGGGDGAFRLRGLLLRVQRVQDILLPCNRQRRNWQPATSLLLIEARLVVASAWPMGSKVKRDSLPWSSGGQKGS
jgi:hypothetical protein